MIVVTGAAGNVGRLVAEELARTGARMRLLVRDRARAPDVSGRRGRRGRLRRPRLAGRRAPARRPGVHGLDSRRPGAPPAAPPVVHRGGRPRRGRTRRLPVVRERRPGRGLPARPLPRRDRGDASRLGLAWTAIRNGMYADEALGWFDPDGVAREPGGDGRISFSYRPELARAIAVVLAEPGHEGRVYDITTPESVTLAELARIASDATGRPHSYEPGTDEDWIRRWRGRDAWRIEAGRTSYAALRSGEFDVVTDDYRALTGRDPLPLAEIVRRLSRS